MGGIHQGIISLILLVSIIQSEALMCYDCKFVTDCGDPFNKDVSGVMMGPCLYCQKIKKSGKVERHCIMQSGGVTKPSNKCVTSGDTTTCSCDTETCNTGAMMTGSAAAIGLSFIALTMLNKF